LPIESDRVDATATGGEPRVNAEQPYVIVGAGPAGAAAATALAAARRRVTVLDAGLTLEPEREAARRRMAATAPALWSAADVALTRFSAAGSGGAGYKQLFGSDVAFRDDGALELRADGVAARPSYALGGLSNVWGAGVLPYTESDLRGWPVSAGELGDAYRAVLSFMPYAAEEDELAEHYPLHAVPDGPLLRSQAGEQLLARLRGHAARLARAGYLFGASRLAVRVGHPAPAHGCCYCGHCLDGCPYGHIYNAGDTILALARQGLIDYRPGLHAERLSEDGAQVTVEARALRGDRDVRIHASRVFLAAGAVSSTIVLQRSGLLAERAQMLDSQTLYLPFLWLGRVGATGREPGHTLAQAFLVLDDPDVCANPVHISLYTYNDGLNERARAIHPRLSALLGPALDLINRRLVIGICFLHSDDSHRIESSVGGADGGAQLTARLNPATPAILDRLQRALLRSLAPLGLIPLAPLAERAGAGGGFHSGGSVPMRLRPGPGEADTLGRPVRARRIHVIDSACFPSIPSGTVTLTAMANAHRIAGAALVEDGAEHEHAGARVRA
jgi:choline dehydrogenase-like flavoprotein